MAQGQHKPPVAERKRERDVFLLYGSAFRESPKIEAPALDHKPRASADSTLIALAQLTAKRLQVARACVSLIDETHQHFLAEATPTLPLRPKPEDAAAALWIGNVSVPRSWGVCEEVLRLRTDAVLVIDDLSKNEQYAHRDFVQGGPRWRFYAGVPLVSPRGTVVGVLSIWDGEPRPDPGLSGGEATLLQDFAATIINYLDTYTLRDQYQRGEQFTRGLLSFAQGASALKPFKVFADDSSNRSGSTTAASAGSMHSHKTLSSVGSRTIQASSTNGKSIGTLQNSILPLHSKDMFSRAANVMMASSNLDGVLILDASVAATGHRQFPGTNEEDASSGDSSHSVSSSSDAASTASNRQKTHEDKSPKTCSVLGYAVRGNVSNDGSDFGTLLERDLARLLKEWSTGKITNFTATGASVSSTDDTSSSSAGAEETVPSEAKKKDSGRRFRTSVAVHELLPKARSVAFVPFWDYERSRWFAGCLCWSNSPQRLLSSTVDLNYFKIFSDSIMRELSRLDALASHQQKTTFVASISHELRSPLHGILGTLEFIKDTQLDSFQVTMLNSLHSCGQTLLDTINQVMDYAKSNEAPKTVSSRKLKSSNTIRLSSKPLKTRKIKQSSFDLALATEEVVEAVFSGALYIPVIGQSEDVVQPPAASEDDDPILNADLPTSSNRKQCYIVLDLAQEDDWNRCFTVGAWKRIVMNLFGNAIKYTESGHIQVSLRSSRSDEGDKSTVTLTVKDSGAGMSPSFLANKAFQPFSQENSHASGVGLGLSIVRQIIETSGGKMEVTSEPSVGTTFIVKLSLAKPDVPQPPAPRITEHLPAIARLAGRRVCILHKKHQFPNESSESFENSGGLSRFTDTLAKTLELHLKMKVVQTEDWSAHDADLVICPEPSFDYLDSIRRLRTNHDRAPTTIFVAMDALEAATFRSDVRVKNKESVVEIMTQPCGPYKLAYILNRCLERFDDTSENLPRLTNSQEQKSYALPEPLLAPQKSLIDPPNRHATPTQFSELQPRSLDTEVAYLKPSFTSIESRVIESPPTELKDVLPIHPNSTGRHVLVTDDNAINRRLLVTFLKKHKYTYSEAENGLAALQAYQNPNVRHDFILMDMSMPVMDGMTATRAIRQYEQAYNVPRCCIIVLTGLASNSARLEAWSSGIDQYLTKPVNFQKLAEILGQEKERRFSIENAKPDT